jgi:transcriptional regulator
MDHPGCPRGTTRWFTVYGKARILENEAEAEGLLERLTAIYEANQPSPWKANLAGERRAKLLGMIVGFEIPISTIEGKFKLNQNRPIEDQRAVVERLTESRAPLGVAVAKLMKHNLKGKF